jgi:Fanconi anemia group M protein
MTEFQDIFSKKKIKEEEKVLYKIIVDYREKNSLVPAILKRLGFEVEFKELKVGDYILNEIAIERKTIDDFISSIVDKRLEHQIEELQQYEKKLLIIEGIEEKQLYHKNSRVNENAIRGMLLSIELKHNIPIIFSKIPKTRLFS